MGISVVRAGRREDGDITKSQLQRCNATMWSASSTENECFRQKGGGTNSNIYCEKQLDLT